MHIYYDDSSIRIRSMIPDDAKVFFNTYYSYGWHPCIETYENYYREQESGKRKVFIAEYKGEVAGICTLVLNSTEGPFAEMGYPEIVDLCVFFHLHEHGIGNILLDIAENEAFKFSEVVYLAVGVHSGYGPAQKIYVKRGYNFDGSGVWYQGKQLDQYAPCVNDDDLLLFMSKGRKKGRHKLMGRTEDGTVIFKPEDILYIEKVDEKTFAYTIDKVIQLDLSLAMAEMVLDDDHFFRCSKSMIINVNHVEKLKSLPSNRIDATMLGGEHIMISRTYASDFRKFLKGE